MCSLTSAPLLGEMGQHLLWVGPILITLNGAIRPYLGWELFQGRDTGAFHSAAPMPSTHNGLSKHGQ